MPGAVGTNRSPSSHRNGVLTIEAKSPRDVWMLVRHELHDRFGPAQVGVSVDGRTAVLMGPVDSGLQVAGFAVLDREPGDGWTSLVVQIRSMSLVERDGGPGRFPGTIGWPVPAQRRVENAEASWMRRLGAVHRQLGVANHLVGAARIDVARRGAGERQHVDGDAVRVDRFGDSIARLRGRRSGGVLHAAGCRPGS